MGTLLVIEMNSIKLTKEAEGKLRDAAIFCRPIGNVIYFMSALATEKERCDSEIQKILQVFSSINVE